MSRSHGRLDTPDYYAKQTPRSSVFGRNPSTYPFDREKKKSPSGSCSASSNGPYPTRLSVSEHMEAMPKIQCGYYLVPPTRTQIQLRIPQYQSLVILVGTSTGVFGSISDISDKMCPLLGFLRRGAPDVRVHNLDPKRDKSNILHHVLLLLTHEPVGGALVVGGLALGGCALSGRHRESQCDEVVVLKPI